MSTLPGMDKYLASFDRKHIRYYLRNRKNQLVGMLVAYKDEDGHLRIGWSKCKVKMDKFDKEIGFYIALRRAEKREPYKRNTHYCVKGLPHCVTQVMPKFVERVNKYYKS